MSSTTPLFPMRINKYLAFRGYTTRKGADGLLRAGVVTINGRPALLGEKVSEQDVVEVQKSALPARYMYLAYHKPRGIVTHSAHEYEIDIRDCIKKRDPLLEVFPIGRLDKNSHGLIILTNDGRIVEPLLSPARTHEKEYEVTVIERLRADFVSRMERGVDIGDYVTKPCTVTRLDNHTFSIVLTEGKNHQIKRMCDALGYTVSNLQRIRIMHIELDNLPEDTYRHLTDNERETLLSALIISTRDHFSHRNK